MTETPPWALILGATSAMAHGFAGELAQKGHALLLAGRDLEELEYLAADLRVRHQVQVQPVFLDALAFETHAAFFGECLDFSEGQLEGVVLALGHLGEQGKAQHDFEAARRILDTNFTAAVSLLQLVADHLEAQKEGWICGISSVAGDRGRQSNYLYGSAKGALTLFLQGLRVRLFKSGVNVTTVKPGFVDTKMTFGLPGLFLVASPESVAKRALSAVRARKAEVYAPWFWYWIMLVIRWVPDFLFKRLKL
jgi:short-subunit dehydrogenase